MSLTLLLGCEGINERNTPSMGMATASSTTALPIGISSSGRHLVDADGAPFLLHGDTAWSIMVQLDREETGRYLRDRSEKGFNAILVLLTNLRGSLANGVIQK